MEQALVKSVFLNAETLPPGCLETHIYKLHYACDRVKKNYEAEKATAQLVLHQWRELVEWTLKPSPNQQKNPFTLQPEIGNS